MGSKRARHAPQRQNTGTRASDVNLGYSLPERRLPRPPDHGRVHPVFTTAFFNPRFRSLPRGNLLVLGSLLAALLLSHFPHLEATPWLLLPLLGIALGTADTARCMRKRWNFYHGGVILCIYMDLLVLILVLFLLLYPALT